MQIEWKYEKHENRSKYVDVAVAVVVRCHRAIACKRSDIQGSDRAPNVEGLTPQVSGFCERLWECIDHRANVQWANDNMHNNHKTLNSKFQSNCSLSKTYLVQDSIEVPVEGDLKLFQEYLLGALIDAHVLGISSRQQAFPVG